MPLPCSLFRQEKVSDRRPEPPSPLHWRGRRGPDVRTVRPFSDRRDQGAPGPCSDRRPIERVDSQSGGSDRGSEGLVRAFPPPPRTRTDSRRFLRTASAKLRGRSALPYPRVVCVSACTSPFDRGLVVGLPPSASLLLTQQRNRHPTLPAARLRGRRTGGRDRCGGHDQCHLRPVALRRGPYVRFYPWISAIWRGIPLDCSNWNPAGQLVQLTQH